MQIRFERLLQCSLVLCFLAAAGPPASRAGSEAKDHRHPVPDEAAQTKARALIREVFQDDYAAAEADEAERARFALAVALLDQGIETKDDLVVKYCCFTEAMNLLARTTDWDRLLQAVDELTAVFQVDPFAAKGQALASIADKWWQNEESRAFVTRHSLGLCRVASDEDEFTRAGQALAAARQYAERAADPALLGEAAAEEERFAVLRNEYETAQNARRTLDDQPGHPAASLTLGRYLCFRKADWDAGVPLLAAGADTGLKKAAEAELEPPHSGRGFAAVGDAWWQLAERAENDDLRTRMRLRAGVWYERAYALLSDEPQVAVLQRLEQIDALQAATPSGRNVGGERSIDLLPLIEPKRDSVSGMWFVLEGGLYCESAHELSRIEIPYAPPEEYDFRVAFITLRDNPQYLVQMVSMPHLDTACQWAVGAADNTLAGFELITGFTVFKNKTTVRREFWLDPIWQQTMAVEVRKDRLRGFVDGELIVEYRTDLSDVSPQPVFGLRDKRMLGLATGRTPTLFQKVELVLISGRGVVLRKPRVAGIGTPADGGELPLPALLTDRRCMRSNAIVRNRKGDGQ